MFQMDAQRKILVLTDHWKKTIECSSISRPRNKAICYMYFCPALLLQTLSHLWFTEGKNLSEPWNLNHFLTSWGFSCNILTNPKGRGRPVGTKGNGPVPSSCGVRNPFDLSDSLPHQDSEHQEPLKVLLGRYSFMPPPNRRVVVRHNLAWTVFHCIKLLWYHQLKILKNNLHLYSMLK